MATQHSGVLVHRPGLAVKAVPRGNGLVEGYLLVWGSPQDSDLEGEHFTRETDLRLDWYPARPVLYHHGMDETVGLDPIGVIKSHNVDDVGVWITAQLDKAKKYASAVYDALQTQMFGWSSGSVDHLVKVAKTGQILAWPIVEGSITPTPAQPAKTTVAALKSILDVDRYSDYLRELDHLARVEAAATDDLPIVIKSSGGSEMAVKKARRDTMTFVRSVLKQAGVDAEPEEIAAIAAEVEPELDDAVMADELDDDAVMADEFDDDAMMADGLDDDAMMMDGLDDDAMMADGLDDDAMMADEFDDDAMMADGLDDDAMMADEFGEEEAVASYRRMVRNASRRGGSRVATPRQKKASQKSAGFIPYDVRNYVRRLEKRVKSLEMLEGPSERYVGRGIKSTRIDGVTDEADRPGAYENAFKSMIRFGEVRLMDREKYVLRKGYKRYTDEVSVNDNYLHPSVKALNISDAGSFGYGVPEDWLTELNTNVASATVMAQDCKVRQTSSDTILQPDLKTTDARRAYPGTAVWPGESPAAATEHVVTEMTLGQIRIPIHVLLVNTTATMSALEDVAFDLQATITEQFAELIAVEYDTLIWAGDGQGKLLGIVTDSRITGSASSGVSTVGGYIASGSTTGIADADKIIDMFMHLPAPYRARAKWYANSNTMRVVKELKDGLGRYLWGDEQGLNAGIPTTILQRPVVYNEFASDIASAAFPLMVGDLSRGYLIGKRVEFSIRRLDDSAYAVKDQVLFLGRARLGGQVIQPAAFKVLKCATS